MCFMPTEPSFHRLDARDPVIFEEIRGSFYVLTLQSHENAFVLGAGSGEIGYTSHDGAIKSADQIRVLFDQ